MTHNDSRAVAIWLLAVAALVFAMVILGGVTRLTRSGLSIVEWNLITGVVPPLTEPQWSAEFDKYKQSPEYRQINVGMTLDGFKRIFYVEWAHRLLGRVIGFAFLLPLLYFALMRKLERALVPKLVALLILGGLQGALGWFMVKSGLVDVPRVSPYRLTAHLGLAVVIYGYLLWIALDLLFPGAPRAARTWRRAGWVVTALVFTTVLAGGFVAGTKAGFAFNTWPLMFGQLIPPGMFALNPWWSNFFENIPTVQFNHRMLAYTTVIAVAAFAWLGLRQGNLSARTQLGLILLAVTALVQLLLGIATVLHAVPVALGALHQAGALALFTAALYLNHTLRGKST